jgi:hypothetical protein
MNKSFILLNKLKVIIYYTPNKSKLPPLVLIMKEFGFWSKFLIDHIL